MRFAFLMTSILAFAGDWRPSAVVDSIHVEALSAFDPSRTASAITDILPSPWVDLIVKAESVDGYLLCQNWQTTNNTCEGAVVSADFEPYAIRQSGGQLTEDEVRRLKAILLDPADYVVAGIGNSKTCITDFNIGYILTVRSERSGAIERVIVSICHSCSVVTIRWRGSTIVADIDYAGDDLLEMSKQLFPNDSKTTSLYERLHGKYQFRQVRHE